MLRIRIRREAIARYGINAAQTLAAVEAIGGRVVGEVVEGNLRFDIRVRVAESYRHSAADIGRVAFGSARLAVFIYTNIPLAATGGVFALALRGSHSASRPPWASSPCSASRC